MTDEEIERKKRQAEGESKLQHALKHQLGILAVGNETFENLIDSARRYDVSPVHLRKMKEELEFLINCINEMEEWFRMFREEGSTDFFSYRRKNDAGNDDEDNSNDYENNLYHLFNETPTKFL